MTDNSTYSSHPFVSYDGPDATGHRAEVRVVTGFGYIKSVEKSDRGKSVKVSFQVANTKYLTSGWVPIADPIARILKEAKTAREPIHFRVETRRKDNIDRKIPIAELIPLAVAKDSVVKALVAVRRDDDAEWTISPTAKTRLEEDPVSGSPSAYDFPLEQLKDSPKPGATATASVASSGYDLPEWQTFGPDGEVNPASAAAGLPIEAYFFVSGYFEEMGVRADEKMKLAAVRAILRASAMCQTGIYGGAKDSPDMSAPSFHRAMHGVFEAAKRFFPITTSTFASEESTGQWVESVAQKNVRMWGWAMTEVKNIAG